MRWGQVVVNLRSLFNSSSDLLDTHRLPEQRLRNSRRGGKGVLLIYALIGTSPPGHQEEGWGNGGHLGVISRAQAKGQGYGILTLQLLLRGVLFSQNSLGKAFV